MTFRAPLTCKEPSCRSCVWLLVCCLLMLAAVINLVLPISSVVHMVFNSETARASPKTQVCSLGACGSQGPATNQGALEKLNQDIRAGRRGCADLINYSKDGRPFLHKLQVSMTATSRGLGGCKGK